MKASGGFAEDGDHWLDNNDPDALASVAHPVSQGIPTNDLRALLLPLKSANSSKRPPTRGMATLFVRLELPAGLENLPPNHFDMERTGAHGPRPVAERLSPHMCQMNLFPPTPYSALMTSSS